MEMKKNKFGMTILALSAICLALSGCESVLDPMPNGHYTDENLSDYPTKLRGFVDKAYSLANTNTYVSNEYIYFDCATEDGVLSSPKAALRKLAQGIINPADDPFATFWERDYQGIYYCNRFLKDNEGLNTQYLISHEADSLLRHNYQGDAFALRAWFAYDLLRKFGGEDLQGGLSGVPIIVSYFEQSEVDPDSWTRPSFDACVKQILQDCDSAYKYLPVGNRDWLAINTQVQGACRWQKFDQQSITALKALTYLLWASDAYNPQKDVTRWEEAARYAWEAIQFKLTEDGVHGFDPLASYDFLDPNNKDALWISRNSGKNASIETHQYPNDFRGNADYTPSQNLVDAFPMANGYPITDERSGYDPKNPFNGRDPRLYATIFYHGATAKRNGIGEVMYTFDMTGKDRAGLQKTGLTNYFLKKFVYMGWNGSDPTVQTMPRSVVYMGWRDMIFAYAEAVNRVCGPSDARFGISARDALSYIRARKTFDGVEGIGAQSDPYLDECAADAEAFETLLRNERRIEFCFEGKRFYDLTRWGVPLSERNVPVYRAELAVGEDGSVTYDKVPVYDINLRSTFLPLPFVDMQRAAGLVQNKGWNSWSRK